MWDSTSKAPGRVEQGHKASKNAKTTVQRACGLLVFFVLHQAAKRSPRRFEVTADKEIIKMLERPGLGLQKAGRYDEVRARGRGELRRSRHAR